jgi:hypothetical protein
MGPMGLGPMTGRRAGYCAGYAVPGFMNAGPAGGFRGGRGWGGSGGGGGGWRHRHWYYATGMPGWQRGWMGRPGAGAWPLGMFPPALSREEELEALREQAASAEQALGELKTRIGELEQSEARGKSSSGKGER